LRSPAWNRFADRSRKGGLGRLSSPAGSNGTGAPSAGRLVGYLGLFASVVLSLSVFGGAAASSAFAEACPNEALRAENNSLALGDCRAFERVTPSFQNGFGNAGIEALAPGGEELIAHSTPGFAGAESNRLGPYYKMIRTEDGWETESINPPGSIFPRNNFYSASGDLSRSIWALSSPDESIYAQNLYRREPNGSFVKIGPMVPPSSETGTPANGMQFFLGAYEFRGASADLSHVYFSIINGVGQSVVWPGDTTTTHGVSPARAFSLYEYAGVGNARPALVGVNTQGRLISDCATFLGSDDNHEMYNAVSTDGERAFFTADGHEGFVPCPESFFNNGITETLTAPEVTEVYARLRGQETVAISEPVIQDCEACRTTERKAAQFQGASADGSKVFFTTTQELLAGAETNNLYEYNFSAARGRRVRRVSVGPEAAEVLGVARISEDGSHVYFVARGNLTTGPNGEGESPTVGQPNLYVYAVDAEHPLGQVSFVATLAESDEAVWRSSDSRPVQTTPDGQYVVFDSRAALTPGVFGSGPQVFEYVAKSEELIRVSRGQNGYPQGTANANGSIAFISSQEYELTTKPTSPDFDLAISEDGSQIQFSSPAALTPSNEAAAEAEATSVYEYRSSGPIANGDVFPLSGGRTFSQGQGISADGENAFFSNQDRLVSGQADSQLNIFDARAGGGFSAQVGSAVCEGEHCLEVAPPVPPSPPPPGTLAATAGNSAPPVHKKKQKKHHKKNHHSKKGHQKSKQPAGSKQGGGK
jgi:hypothetical protein